MQRSRVDGARNSARGEQRTNLARKENCVAGFVEIQRLDAKRVAREVASLLVPVPEREREHATQFREKAGAPVCPADEQDFSVAAAAEFGAVALQFITKLSKIVDLTVVAQAQPAVAGQHRLVAGAGEVENRQP